MSEFDIYTPDDLDFDVEVAQHNAPNIEEQLPDPVDQSQAEEPQQ